MTNIITTQNLTKKYRDFTAINNLNLNIKKGRIYGFLGPNGAGKSTTMKILLGLVKQSSGHFNINGSSFPLDRVHILSQIGSLIESPSYYGNLTGYENLELICAILNLPKSNIEDVLSLVGLSDFKHRLVKKYSLGMKQRLGLASALIGNPPILILDEPTNGLDPSGIREIRNLIKSLPTIYDCTVLISSHILSEVELLADDIGILNRGNLLFEGSIEDLKNTSINMGLSDSNLEETFLKIIESDNIAKKQGAIL